MGRPYLTFEKFSSRNRLKALRRLYIFFQAKIQIFLDSCPRSNSVDVEDETCSSSSEEYDSQDQDLLSDSDVLDWIPEEDDGSVKTGFLQ